MGTINTSMHAVQQAQADLNEVDNLPPLGQDMVNFLTLESHLNGQKISFVQHVYCP